MLSAIYNIGAGLARESQRQELISQNLAGAGLCGFKGRHLTVSTFRRRMAQSGEGAYDIDAGKPTTDFTQGGLTPSGRALDFALVGEGFFQIETPDGATVLTRNGNFSLAPDGTLVTQEGYAVQGQNGPIRLNPTDDATKIQVAEDGQITLPAEDGTPPRTVGVIAVVNVDQPEKMTRLSANYFLPGKNVSVSPADNIRVCNRYREQSNTSPVREMAEMIQSLREFESGQTMIKTINELARDANQKTG
jgi:flagellar basal-body rod protein FlgG